MRILSVDDDDDNLFLVARTARSREYEVVSAHNGIEALQQLEAGSFDLIISDILMPGMDGFRLCKAVKDNARFRKIPFIFYTATYTAKEDKELAVALGASRFVIKPAGRDEFLSIIEEVIKEGAAGNIPVPAVDLDDGGKGLTLYNERLVHKLERKIEQLESARAESYRFEEQLRLTWDASMDGMVLSDESGVILRANRAFGEIVGKPAEALAGQAVPLCRDETGASILAPGRDLIRSGEFEKRCEGALGSPDGAVVRVEVSRTVVGLPSGAQALFCVVRDVTARLRLEEEQEVLRSQLHQSQKLEAIGRLAGGVAHDFNNLLTVIIGYTDILGSAAAPGSRERYAINEVALAAERASSLTRQLLAFSRRQVLKPEALNLNQSIQKIRGMLSRLIGENIEVIADLADGLWSVSADPGQIDQIIVNLAVNARDAMEHGGKLTIQTSNVVLTDEYSAKHLDVTPGEYVRLVVTDSGHGMDPETREQIFEPFFTTKEAGRGTGLGLATVYGIVKQSGGDIWVYSEVGIGTSINVYLPRLVGAAERIEQPSARVPQQGTESVLLVEDEESLRKLITQLLEVTGYRVLAVANIDDALEICNDRSITVDVLLTDLVLSKGTGWDIATKALQVRPGLKTLFMSGYSEGSVFGGRSLKPGVNFIQKPFNGTDLRTRIREIIEATPADRT